MTGTNHVLTGVVIGLTVHQPALAIPLALGSHFVMDALPHYGDPDITSRRFFRILAAEGLAIFTILLLVAVFQPDYWWLAIICGLVAASPDFMWLPNFIRDLSAHRERKPYTNPISRFHKYIQWGEKSHNWPYELVWLGFSLVIVFRLLSS